MQICVHLWFKSLPKICDDLRDLRTTPLSDFPFASSAPFCGYAALGPFVVPPLSSNRTSREAFYAPPYPC